MDKATHTRKFKIPKIKIMLFCIVMKIQIRTWSFCDLERVSFSLYEAHFLLLQQNIPVSGIYQDFGANYLHSYPTVEKEGVQEWI